MSPFLPNIFVWLFEVTNRTVKAGDALQRNLS